MPYSVTTKNSNTKIIENRNDINIFSNHSKKKLSKYVTFSEFFSALVINITHVVVYCDINNSAFTWPPAKPPYITRCIFLKFRVPCTEYVIYVYVELQKRARNTKYQVYMYIKICTRNRIFVWKKKSWFLLLSYFGHAYANYNQPTKNHFRNEYMFVSTICWNK